MTLVGWTGGTLVENEAGGSAQEHVEALLEVVCPVHRELYSSSWFRVVGVFLWISKPVKVKTSEI